MAIDPISIAKRRAGRAIDWRVAAAVTEATTRFDERAETMVSEVEQELKGIVAVVEVGRRQDRDADILDNRQRFDDIDASLDAAIEAIKELESTASNRETEIEDTVARLRSSITSIATSITDRQRAADDLIEQLVRRIDVLEQHAAGSLPEVQRTSK